MWIDGKTAICLNTREQFTGYATDAVSGLWDLPDFNVFDASWTPDAPTQWVEAAVPGTYTWTLTVQSANGQTATAQFSFTAFNC